ncbi:hypothetical protein NHH03_27420 [Stieleria sp. TO1_6]|uniref:hypothetical protein n=1 Tax=Stieleria tagensis TaxID=2956795 RepID=UPI00209B6C55|nr:hypothetical protein [Stieleria tagensis]MCO8125499.1 hypothetical protein [Stieleria tagensis]
MIAENTVIPNDQATRSHRLDQPAEAQPGRATASDLQALAAEICRDAQQEPIHYLVRSNTSYDGE